MTQSLAEAGRDRENIRSELFRALETVQLGNSEQDRVGGKGEGREQVDPASGPRGYLILQVRPLTLASSPCFCLLLQGPPPNPLCLLHLGAIYVSDTRHPAGSCKQCPTSWLPFQGSCYFFSDLQATWEAAQRNCAEMGAHLVIVQGLDEQVRSLAGPRREVEFSSEG